MVNLLLTLEKADSCATEKPCVIGKIRSISQILQVQNIIFSWFTCVIWRWKRLIFLDEVIQVKVVLVFFHFLSADVGLVMVSFHWILRYADERKLSLFISWSALFFYLQSCDYTTFLILFPPEKKWRLAMRPLLDGLLLILFVGRRNIETLTI